MDLVAMVVSGPGLRGADLTHDYQVVIIGSGPGGYVAAIGSGQLGLKTAFIERDDKFGGTCLHWGLHPHQDASVQCRDTVKFWAST